MRLADFRGAILAAAILAGAAGQVQAEGGIDSILKNDYENQCHKIISTDGMLISEEAGVSCEHPLAARTGLEIMQQGGNAVDAMVAVALVLCVVDNGMHSLGGYGGAMVIYRRGFGDPVVVDFPTRAPQKANFADLAGKIDISQYPSNMDIRPVLIRLISTWNVVAGLYTALEKYGTMSWQEVIQPAIRYAEEGFIVSGSYVHEFSYVYNSKVRCWPASVAIFGRPDGGYLQPGDRLVQKDLAQSLRILAEEGPNAIYTGRLAVKMVDYIQSQGGWMAMEDLADWQGRLVRILKPAHTNYRGYDVYTSPFCSGGENLIEILNILKGFNLGEMGFSGESVHLILETYKQAFADRFAYVADPWMKQVPYVGLMSQDYADQRRQAISRDKVLEKAIAGDPWPYNNAGLEAFVPAGQLSRSENRSSGTNAHNSTSITNRESDITTASSSIIDARGNLVALTMTVRDFLGCGVTVPQTGIVLNDGMVLFNDQDPNNANCVQGGKLGVNNMNAFLILKDGMPFITAGSAGGQRIMTNCIALIVRVIDWKMGLQEAIAAPRFHVEDNEPCLLEENFPYWMGKELETMGHRFISRSTRLFGTAHAIMVDPDTGKYHFARDPRRDYSAAGGFTRTK